MTQCILQRLKVRNAILSNGDELPVDHRVDLHVRLGDLDAGVADDLAVAAEERNLAAVDLSVIIRNPSYLSSNTQLELSTGMALVSVASIGYRRFGSMG